MALILSPDQHYKYLSDHHTFGRLLEKVDTLVDDDFVSRIHAVIQWQSPYWKLRDLSTNGTWINGTRIPRNQQIKLSLNDKIQLGSPESKPIIFVENSEPSDVLIGPQEQKDKIPTVIPLKVYHFFPDEQTLDQKTFNKQTIVQQAPEEQAPEVVLYKKNNLWFADKLNESSSTPTTISNGDKITFNQQEWTVRLLQNSHETMPVEFYKRKATELSVKFEVSLDEEHCNVTVSHSGQSIDLCNHSHHLMTLMLARYRAKDMQEQLPDAEQGWVYVDQLSKDIGLEERHINIQIHRARKQLSEKLDTECSSTGLIERRRGQIRLGFSEFEVLKGGKPEYANVASLSH